MKKSAFNEEDRPYVEVFKEWLESSGHTSFSELINWEHENSEIEISFRNESIQGSEIKINQGIHDWNLFWRREILDKIDKKEKDLELEILITKWFLEDIINRLYCGRLIPSLEENLKELENTLTDYRDYKYWKQNRLVLIFGIILLFTLTTYLMWPSSSKSPTKETAPDNDWARPNRPLWLY